MQISGNIDLLYIIYIYSKYIYIYSKYNVYYVPYIGCHRIRLGMIVRYLLAVSTDPLLRGAKALDLYVIEEFDWIPNYVWSEIFIRQRFL
jgi:hypothetical protein